MNYQCQFIIRDELTNIKYESPRHAFFHNTDTITLKWKGESIIITNNTTIQTFHVYLEPYLLDESLNLNTGRIHWFSGRLYQSMKTESIKVKLLGDEQDAIFIIKHIRMTLFMNHLKKHAHQLNCVIQFIRPWKRCIFAGRAQHISEVLDEKRVYTWLPQKEKQVAFPGIRMLQETNRSELYIMGALLSPKRRSQTVPGPGVLPDNPFFSNLVRTLPIPLEDETVIEFKFYNVDQFLFEVVIKRNMLKDGATKLRQVVNPFFVFELNYTEDRILAMKLHVILFKVALNMEHNNKNNITI